MSLSPVKKEVLETLSRNGKPMKVTEVAKETGKEVRPVMGHILGLVRMGYVSSPEKSMYAITQKGREALGTSAESQMSKEKAEAILAYAPHDKAFAFYADVGRPLNIHAHGLRDFANKVERVELDSLKFHMDRGDFAAWFSGLGDKELAEKVAALKEKNVAGEDLRSQLHAIVEQRYVELAKLTGQPVCPE